MKQCAFKMFERGTCRIDIKLRLYENHDDDYTYIIHLTIRRKKNISIYIRRR